VLCLVINAAIMLRGGGGGGGGGGGARRERFAPGSGLVVGWGRHWGGRSMSWVGRWASGVGSPEDGLGAQVHVDQGWAGGLKKARGRR
jgi:hypothetical protein